MLVSGLQLIQHHLMLDLTQLNQSYPCAAVFRSAIDVWAIDQLFPIMPIHRLEEEPRESAVLADITCDSDGKFDRFISSGLG